MIFFLSFFAYYFLKLHLHHYSKIKESKRSHKTVGIKVLLTLLFCLIIEGSGSVPRTNGSGRPKNIRIRIRNTTTILSGVHYCYVTLHYYSSKVLHLPSVLSSWAGWMDILLCVLNLRQLRRGRVECRAGIEPKFAIQKLPLSHATPEILFRWYRTVSLTLAQRTSQRGAGKIVFLLLFVLFNKNFFNFCLKGGWFM